MDCPRTKYMNSVCVPAEFKHICKRRRANNIGYRQSLRTNTVFITIGIVYTVIEMLYNMYYKRLGGCVRFVITSD